MSVHNQELDQQVKLRMRAHARLTGQGVQGVQEEVSSGGAAALGVLLDLAASPDTAADALAVLHELQVHQVELEMQSEELRNAMVDQEAALARQVQLYDCAPVAQFTVDVQMRLLEVNLTGAQLLATDREALFGQRLDGFLTEGSARDLGQLLSTASQGPGIKSAELRLNAGAEAHRLCHAAINVGPQDGRFIVVLMAR
jgi:PAS domain-containing protein